MKSTFDQQFLSLTEFCPMKWQSRLFERFVANNLPAVCDIPTGLGKTSILVIWLLALVRQAEDGRICLPRRLVYIVNRRTVVDQATDVVEQIRRRLVDPGNHEWKAHADTLEAIARKLRGLCVDGGVPMAVSTLRGELADNEEWKVDPARPAIIIGTIDMVGSKLLFSGYGDGRYNRAHHAGLIGQDVLIVHDEAHLTPAYSRLLWAIEWEQRSGESAGDRARSIVVMELSATMRHDEEMGKVRQEIIGHRSRGGGSANEVFPSPQERAGVFDDPIVQQRIRAEKSLRIAPPAQPEDNLSQIVAAAALKHENKVCRVLVYVRSPEDARTVADALRAELGQAADGRIALLTGTIRGHERDQLAASDLFNKFKSDASRAPRLEHTLYLVSTSAGEVGVDLDADHLVCDLTTLDSMAQRFGRVNRLGVDGGGAQREASITVVEGPIDDKDPLKAQVEKTGGVLRNLPRRDAGYDASPAALSGLLRTTEAEEAFSPKGRIAPLTDILLDNWSLTSIDAMPGRPAVAAYLHGLTADPPETYVAWRREVLMFKALEPSRDGRSEEVHRKAKSKFEEALRDWFAASRIEARERLRDHSDRVRKKLGALLDAHRKRDGGRDFPVVLLDERGRAEWSTLSAISEKPGRNSADMLHYRTVVLPVEAGGLDIYGMLDGKAVDPADQIDVAEAGVDHRERWLYRSAEGEPYEQLVTGETADRLPDGLREEERVTLKEPADGAEDEGETLELILLTDPSTAAVENPERVRFRQALDDHTRQIVERANSIATALGLAAGLRDALVSAARWHDRGKDRRRWQFYARNEYGNAPLAKSDRYRDPRLALGGYRHEFGSLLEALTARELDDHAERDLILHLIAAHHGWARPHFEPRAYGHEGPLDPTTGERRAQTTAENERAAVETLQRFGRLQQRFGRWGLAWLESLLRCADIAASKRAAASEMAAGTATTPRARGVKA
jgi:CRISPR-associated endonuclease/helicase Cas3